MAIKTSQTRKNTFTKEQIRKTHPAGQTRVPAERNRAKPKTTNVPTISIVSSLRLTAIRIPLLTGKQPISLPANHLIIPLMIF
jgi:hypothetical protein